MDNFLNEQSVKILDNKFFHIINYIIPGIFVSELFFKRGFFSNIPTTLYEFLLYLLWCFIFSVPYGILSPFSITSLLKNMKDEILKDKTIDKREFLENFEKFMIEKKEDNEKLDSVIAFLYNMVYIILTFFIFKALTYYFEYNSFLNIGVRTIIFLNTIIIFYLVYYFIIRRITLVIEKRYSKYSC